MKEITSVLRDLDRGFIGRPDAGIEPMGDGVNAWYAVRQSAMKSAQQLRKKCNCLDDAGGEVVSIEQRTLSTDEKFGLAKLLGASVVEASPWTALAFLLRRQ